MVVDLPDRRVVTCRLHIPLAPVWWFLFTPDYLHPFCLLQRSWTFCLRLRPHTPTRCVATLLFVTVAYLIGRFLCRVLLRRLLAGVVTAGFFYGLFTLAAWHLSPLHPVATHTLLRPAVRMPLPFSRSAHAFLPAAISFTPARSATFCLR